MKPQLDSYKPVRHGGKGPAGPPPLQVSPYARSRLRFLVPLNHQPRGAVVGVSPPRVAATISLTVASPRMGRTFDFFPRALGNTDPVGGRLQAFLPTWAAIADDKFVLSVVRNGLVISLVEPLPGGTLRTPTRIGTRRVRSDIALEIAVLLKKRAIERVADHPRLCLSPVFVIPKRSGKSRMILNLKAINQSIRPVHFWMETLAAILPMLKSGDWTCP